MIKSGQHGFARFVHNIGGKGIFAMVTGAVGAVAGALIHKAIAPKEAEPEPVVIYRDRNPEPKPQAVTKEGAAQEVATAWKEKTAAPAPETGELAR